MFIFEALVEDEVASDEEELWSEGPLVEVDEDAMERIAMGVILRDEVDVVDVRDTDFPEDGADAFFGDVGEDPGDAEGRLMRSELTGGVGHVFE